MSSGGDAGTRKMPRWRIWLSATRPRTLAAAVAPVVVGTALAMRDGSFSMGAAALCLAFALLIQIGTNFSNDYHDFMKGADTPDRLGPRRAVAAGLVSPGSMRNAAILAMAAAFLIGLGLVGRGGPWLLAIGILSIACGLAYTGGPYPLGYHGFGDVSVFVFFGLVAVCATYFVQVGQVTAEALLAAVPIGLLAANILLVNNYRDSETDAAAGKRTLVVRFGRRIARVQHAASLAVSLAMPFVFLLRGDRASCLLPVAMAPLAFSHVRRLKSDPTPPQLVALLGNTSGFLAVYAALAASGFLLR